MKAFLFSFQTRTAGFLVLACLLGAAGCQPVKQPKGAEREYLDSTDLFKQGRLDRALDFSEGLAEASPPVAYTDRARVLRLVIYGGRLRGYTEVAEAYTAGAKNAKKANFKGDYERLRSEALQLGASAAMGMAETAHLMLSAPGIGKEVVLEVPCPDAEGPPEVAQLAKVKEGQWIEPPDQEAAALAAQRKGIDEELALLAGTDRTQLRAKLGAGPVKIAGADFALLLGKDLLAAATAFDQKHFNDYSKLKLVAEQADQAAQAELNLLKDSPDKDKEKAAKKLQSDIKELLKKNLYAQGVG